MTTWIAWILHNVYSKQHLSQFWNSENVWCFCISSCNYLTVLKSFILYLQHTQPSEKHQLSPKTLNTLEDQLYWPKNTRTSDRNIIWRLNAHLQSCFQTNFPTTSWVFLLLQTNTMMPKPKSLRFWRKNTPDQLLSFIWTWLTKGGLMGTQRLIIFIKQRLHTLLKTSEE